jgi:PAS domain S-box-containing protein
LLDAREAERRLYEEHDVGDPFAAAIRGTRMAMIVTDPRQQDNPIIFANDAFCRLTGYDHDEVIGRNCRFLQGAETSERDVEKLRRAISSKTDAHVELMNYRKDGTPFWNSLFISPVRNSAGDVVFFFGSQLDVSGKKQTEFDLHTVNDELRETKSLLEQQIDDRTAELMRLLAQRSRLVNELDHRVKNNLQLISSLLNFELRGDLGQEARDTVTRLHQRIDALGLAHKDQHNKDAIGYFRVDNFIRILIDKVLNQSRGWRRGGDYDLDEVALPIGKAAPLALALNEFSRALVANPPADDDVERILNITGRDADDYLIIRVVSTDMQQQECDTAISSVEPWTRKLLESQLSAEITAVEGRGGCGLQIKMPKNGIHHEH